MDDLLYAFGEADTEQIKRMLGGSTPAAGSPLAEPAAAPCLIAVATSTITARVGTTLGTGTANVKWIDDSGVLQAGSDVDVVNLGSAIANGAYIKLFRVGNRLSAVEIC
jgi:hypothetical protein